MTHAPCPPVALTIAGSDSGGGAGIQADLRTFAAYGVHGLTALTAITAQNTAGVSAITMLSGRIVAAQIRAVLDDFPIAAIKIGMIGTPALCRTISEALADARHIPLIVDPVLVATSGATLSRGSLVAAIRHHLIPHADLLTPNLPEAEQILGRPVRSREDMLTAARDLRSLGAKSVLLKGGHLQGPEVADLMLGPHGEEWFTHARIEVEGHGTGCTLAAAVAAGVAKGWPIAEAAREAIAFVNRALSLAYRPGRGNVVVLDHLSAASR
jgi:hydroxymethylpyrimidine/phosphomethylpyrimidine kinase